MCLLKLLLSYFAQNLSTSIQVDHISEDSTRFNFPDNVSKDVTDFKNV